MRYFKERKISNYVMKSDLFFSLLIFYRIKRGRKYISFFYSNLYVRITMLHELYLYNFLYEIQQEDLFHAKKKK